jgi:hypothetical protein
MKSLIKKLAAATLLVAAPLAAFAHGGDDRHGWGHSGYSHDRGHGWKHGHSNQRYAPWPARVVARPVFVPVPAPVVAVPAPVIALPAPVVAVPAPFPRHPMNSVDIGFRFFF